MGTVAAEFVLQRHSAGTASSYASGVRLFLTFCSEEQVDSLQVDINHILRFIAWVGLRGNCKASSLSNYLTALNSYFRDNGKEPIAQGKLVSDAVKALAQRQQATEEPSHRLPLPATVALKIYNLAVQLMSSWQPSDMVLLRACCATVFSFLFFNRSGTTRSVYNNDVGTRGSDLCFYERKSKGKDHLSDEERTCYIVAVPQLATLFERFSFLKRCYCQTTMQPLPTIYFSLPGETPDSWTSNTQSAWLAQAFAAVEESPPPGFSWTSHSLRSGAAAAAKAEGWSNSQLQKYGGWAVGSTALELSYLKVPVRPCSGSQFFFGWLCDRLLTEQPLSL